MARARGAPRALPSVDARCSVTPSRIVAHASCYCRSIAFIVVARVDQCKTYSREKRGLVRLVSDATSELMPSHPKSCCGVSTSTSVPRRCCFVIVAPVPRCCCFVIVAPVPRYRCYDTVAPVLRRSNLYRLTIAVRIVTRHHTGKW